MAANDKKKDTDLDVAEVEETTEEEEGVYVDSLNATFTAIASAEADEIHANGSAIGSATASSLTATASAIGLANVDGNAHVTVSVVPIVRATGGATLSQAYTSAVIVGGDMQIHQAATPVMIGKSLNATQTLGGVVVTGDAEVTRSTIGVVLSRSANISDDSRVLMSTKAAVIIACALLGGFALVAVAMIMGAQRVKEWRPQFNLPKLKELKEEIRSEIKGFDVHSLPWKRAA